MKMKNPMIKNSVSNFTKNLICLFVPMGIIYLFLLVGIFVFVSDLFTNLSQTLSSFGTLIQSTAEESSLSIREFFAYLLSEVDFEGDRSALLRNVLDRAYLEQVMRSFFETLGGTAAGFEAECSIIIKKFSTRLLLEFSAMAVIWALGIIFANFLTGYIIRKRTVKRNLKKFLLAHTLVPFVQALTLVAAVFLLSIIKLFSLLLFAALLLLFSDLSLLGAYLIHRDESLPRKEILNFKNSLSQIAAAGLIFLFNAALGIILLLINPVLAVLIMLPVVIYSLNVAEVSAESYVLKVLAEKKQIAESEKKAEEI